MSLVVKFFATNQTGLSRASLEERLLYSQPLEKWPTAEGTTSYIWQLEQWTERNVRKQSTEIPPSPARKKEQEHCPYASVPSGRKEKQKNCGENLNAARPIQALASTVRGRNIPMSFLNYLYLYICIYIYIKRTCIIDIYVHGHAHIYTPFSSFCMSSVGTGLYLPTSQG